MTLEIRPLVQLTSDGLHSYLEAVEGAFGADIDYAMLVKTYGAAPESAKGRFSPAECTGAIKTRIEAIPTRSTSQRHLLNVKIFRCGWATVA